MLFELFEVDIHALEIKDHFTELADQVLAQVAVIFLIEIGYRIFVHSHLL